MCEIIASRTQSIELLSECDTSYIEINDLVEVDSLHDFIVEGFSYEIRIGTEDFDIDHFGKVLGMSLGSEREIIGK